MNEIRPTLPQDSAALVALTEGTELFKPLEIQALREVLDDYHAEAHAQGHRCITWVEAGQPTAFAYYAPAAMTERSWYLWWIVVRKDRQGLAIGSRLLQHIEDDIRALAGRLLFVETGSRPLYAATRQFYLKHGYEEHALLRDFYAPGDSMVVFRKEMTTGAQRAAD